MPEPRPCPRAHMYLIQDVDIKVTARVCQIIMMVIAKGSSRWTRDHTEPCSSVPERVRRTYAETCVCARHHLLNVPPNSVDMCWLVWVCARGADCEHDYASYTCYGSAHAHCFKVLNARIICKSWLQTLFEKPHSLHPSHNGTGIRGKSACTSTRHTSSKHMCSPWLRCVRICTAALR